MKSVKDEPAKRFGKNGGVEIGERHELPAGSKQER